MTSSDSDGHLAWLNGRPLPGRCHCPADRAHDVEPTAPAPPDAYNWIASLPFGGGPEEEPQPGLA